MLNRHFAQIGTSLVELMISMAIGFASLTAMASLVGQGIGMNAQLMAKSRLTEEVNAILLIMVNDIKRAGYTANTLDIIQSPNFISSEFRQTVQVSAYPGETTDSCLLFAYDHNQNGVLDTVDTNENFGFRLKEYAVEMRIDGLSCTSNGWQDLSDQDVVKVTHLKFTLQNQVVAGVVSTRVSVELAAELRSLPTISTSVATSFSVKNYG